MAHWVESETRSWMKTLKIFDVVAPRQPKESMSDKKVKVIDLFAGPGGLGEGFTSVNGKINFDIQLSIEKDKFAHQTLSMRARFRELKRREQLEPYYDFLNGKIDLATFLEDPAVARIESDVRNEALLWEMSPDNRAETVELIRTRLGSADNWVLIGGPPCQAYSLVGRARNRHVEDFHEDERHFLYQEYLNVLTELQPPVFVMENVKGLLSSRNRSEGGMFDKILEDLSTVPGAGYDVKSVSVPQESGKTDPADYVVRAENYGVPQARHRVILLGVRSDLTPDFSEMLLVKSDLPVTAAEALSGLPRIRSRLSRGDSIAEWRKAVRAAAEAAREAFQEDAEALSLIADSSATALNLWSFGDDYMDLLSPGEVPNSSAIVHQLRDPKLQKITGHRTRSHMPADLQRYFYAAIYNYRHGLSPKILDFPENLKPNHRNLTARTVPFQDRFRVVREQAPANTIVAHMAKDGHAFIHWDPAQIRSLTIREAARLQTFPDNYYFMGPQTARYSQVGNAVPPLLARQIAEIVARIFI